MKKLLTAATVSFCCLLAGCGAGIKEEVKEDLTNIEESGVELQGEIDYGSAEPGEWLESSNGKFKVTSYGYNQAIGLDFTENPFVPLETGPMEITIQDVWVMDFKPENGQKRVVFGGKDEVRVVTASMVIDNYSDMEISFNPDEAALITNTGEAIEPLKYWTSGIDGNFTPGATKATGVSWALADVESDLTSVRIIIEPPILKENNTPLSEPLEVEIEILPY
ncbi:hypothetical protein [Planomicrobium sp. CPCC 101079]|uniref:hypothetical protein n=1 Tax=Planomicrobium sp. CPCC 101079 TaxID=2599618 RepID=UPI0011B7E8A9|nr:hypothetical protein [Planomicrobium sp. CPCC 101079]TWT08987.1 hypothetical protein FQV28_04955 [Planomicrobium sp. CPCC 101079]